MEELEWEHPETEEVWRVSSEGEVGGLAVPGEEDLDPEPEILVVFKGPGEIRTTRWIGDKPLEELSDEELLDLFRRSRAH